MSRIVHASHADIAAELRKRKVGGLAMSHGEILAALYQSTTPLSLKDIAGRIRRTQPTVTVLVNKLIRLGFATKTRNATDGRSSLIALTDKGQEFRGVFSDISRKMNQALHDGLSDREINQLEQILEKISGHFTR